jgi:thiamine pyrophosphate-dependent acetolactate synthase large subunit-like protein
MKNNSEIVVDVLEKAGIRYLFGYILAGRMPGLSKPSMEAVLS